MMRKKLDRAGKLRRKSRRSKKTATSIRTMVGPARYAEFGYMVQMKPDNRMFEIELSHAGIRATLKRQLIGKYRAVFSKGYSWKVNMRVYVIDYSAVLALQLSHGDDIWKIFKLVPEK